MPHRNRMIPLEIATVMMLMLMCLAPHLLAASKYVVLHNFNLKDGANPGALILDASGNLYGTTSRGGDTTTCSPPYGCGTVFELTPASDGKWSETVLHSFNRTDGTGPLGGLIFDLSGNLYGTTQGGGAYGAGTVFELTPGANGKWTETLLHSFNSTDGVGPLGGLIFDAAGNLYGTTVQGGAHLCPPSSAGCGIVFELTPTTKGEWKETILYSFSYADGAFPYADLIFDANGNLYGTTQRGGSRSFCSHKGCGAVFQLTPSANGKWTETVLHAFRANGGKYPEATLISDATGNFYSTALYGPPRSSGEVFALKTEGGGFTVLHAFTGAADGASPLAGLVFNAAGELFGTTASGGPGRGGTVFELEPGSNGQWTETVLHSFSFSSPDGSSPRAGLVMDASGNLYGTTASGGNSTACSEGCGVVFEITP